MSDERNGERYGIRCHLVSAMLRGTGIRNNDIDRFIFDGNNRPIAIIEEKHQSTQVIDLSSPQNTASRNLADASKIPSFVVVYYYLECIDGLWRVLHAHDGMTTEGIYPSEMERLLDDVSGNVSRGKKIAYIRSFALKCALSTRAKPEGVIQTMIKHAQYYVIPNNDIAKKVVSVARWYTEAEYVGMLLMLSNGSENPHREYCKGLRDVLQAPKVIPYENEEGSNAKDSFLEKRFCNVS